MTDETHPDTGPVAMRTDDVFALADALDADAKRFATDAAAVLAMLADTDDTAPPYGADPRNVPAAQAVSRHGRVRAVARELVAGVSQGLAGMSRSTRAIVTEFGNQDGLNGATVADVRTALNLPEEE